MKRQKINPRKEKLSMNKVTLRLEKIEDSLILALIFFSLPLSLLNLLLSISVALPFHCIPSFHLLLFAK